MGTFLEDVKYVAPCTFHDIRCEMCTKRLYFFRIGERTYGMFYVTLVLYVSPQFRLEMSVEWRYNSITITDE